MLDPTAVVQEGMENDSRIVVGCSGKEDTHPDFSGTARQLSGSARIQHQEHLTLLSES